MTVRDFRVLGHNADICHESDSKTGTHGCAVNGGDDDLGALRHAINNVAGLPECGFHTVVVIDHGFNPFEITASREGIALACNDDDAYIIVIFDIEPDT